jgi:gas vesicle protein
LAALLLTPYSGKELRSTIRQQVDEIQIEIKEAAQNKRAELEKQLEVLIEQKEAK